MHILFISLYKQNKYNQNLYPVHLSDLFLLKTLIQHALFLLEKKWAQWLISACKYTQINYCSHSFGNVMFWLRESSEIRLLWKQLFIFMTELEMRVCLSQQSADSTQMKLNTIVSWSKSQMHIGETLSQFSICSHFLLMVNVDVLLPPLGNHWTIEWFRESLII